jgi:hypothetical protein
MYLTFGGASESLGSIRQPTNHHHGDDLALKHYYSNLY